jgi:hypothetical protein
MKPELQSAWLEFCDSGEARVDQESFIAGWEACGRFAGHSIDELAFVGRQMGQGVPRELVESELSPPRKTAA